MIDEDRRPSTVNGEGIDLRLGGKYDGLTFGLLWDNRLQVYTYAFTKGRNGDED